MNIFQLIQIRDICIFLSNLKTGKNLKEDLKNGKEKGRKEENKEKSDKTHVKMPL